MTKLKPYSIMTFARSGWNLPERPPGRSHNRQVTLYTLAPSKAAAVRQFNTTGDHITMHYFNGYAGSAGPNTVAELEKHPEGTVLAAWLDDFANENLVKVSP
jgi:hypothetical protein